MVRTGRERNGHQTRGLTARPQFKLRHYPQEASPVASCSDAADVDACLATNGRSVHERLSSLDSDALRQARDVCGVSDVAEAEACLEHANVLADADLDAAFLAALEMTGDGSDASAWRRRLKDSQDAWLAFRDRDCGDLTMSERNGAPDTEPAVEACRLGKTEARLADLRNRYGTR